MATYTVTHVDQVDPALLRDLAVGDRPWVVLRHGRSAVAWSFHTTEKLAQAAARRWRSRDIPTR